MSENTTDWNFRGPTGYLFYYLCFFEGALPGPLVQNLRFFRVRLPAGTSLCILHMGGPVWISWDFLWIWVAFLYVDLHFVRKFNLECVTTVPFDKIMLVSTVLESLHIDYCMLIIASVQYCA